MEKDVISGFKVALIQLRVTKEKSLNIKNAVTFIKQAKVNSALLAILPECFNCPYGKENFPEYAESIPDGITSKALSESARSNKIFVIGGSIPEREGTKMYNTCTVWNPNGQMIAKYRKIHLFDVNVPGKMTFKESDSFTPGKDLITFNIAEFKIGLSICHDIRFPELASLYRMEGCDMVAYAGAFCRVLSEHHLELLVRSRANDNQMYVAAVSTACNEESDYITWGHSLMVDPLGYVIATTGRDEAIIYADINKELIERTREQIPLSKQKRSDIYTLERCDK